MTGPYFSEAGASANCFLYSSGDIPTCCLKKRLK